MKNIAIILAGGIGSRMGSIDVPKQYLKVNNKPIIIYTIDIFAMHKDIDDIVIVADEMWRDSLDIYLKELNVNFSYADPGKSRQHSIYNGLQMVKKIAENDDIVIIHDAARPLVNEELITSCIMGAKDKDGAMPVIPIKDTIYLSKDRQTITSLLRRDELFAGQSPEGFKFGKYYDIHKMLNEEEIHKITGSSEIAFNNNMDIKLIEGSEMNFKITTMEDYKEFVNIIEERNKNNESIRT